MLYAEHHESHAASAFFPSPFEEAAILTVDGVGEWATASIGHGKGNDLELVKELQWPDSLGLLYSAFTYHTGFKVNSGEYKVMGLAPYGKPKYVAAITTTFSISRRTIVSTQPEIFNYLSGLTMRAPLSVTCSADRPGFRNRRSRSARWIWRAAFRMSARRSCFAWPVARICLPAQRISAWQAVSR